MGLETVGDDIFKILATFSPKRWGPNDSTVEQPPNPNQMQMPPEAQAPPPTAPDPATTGAVVPPVPVSSRRVDPPPGAGASGYAGGPQAQGGAVIPPASAPGAGADSGGMNVFKIWQDQQAAQAAAQKKASDISGLQSAGLLGLAGLTRSPSMRDVLAGEAGRYGGGAGHGGGGAGGAGGAGALKFEDLLKLQGSELAASQLRSQRARIPALAKQLGTDPGRLELILETDPKKFGEFIADQSKPNTKTITREDGSVYIYDEKDPDGSKREYLEADPAKVAKIAADKAEADRKVKADTQGDENRAGLDAGADLLMQRQPQIKDRATALGIMRNNPQLGTKLLTGEMEIRNDTNGNMIGFDKNDPTAAPRKLYVDQAGADKAKADLDNARNDVINKYRSGDERDYLAMQAEMKAKDMKPRWETYEDYKAWAERARSPTASQTSTNLAIKDMGARGEALYKAKGAEMDATEAMIDKLDKGVYGGSVITDFAGQGARELAGLFGIDDKRAKNTAEFKSLVQAASGLKVKQWGSNASESDAKRAVDAIGGGLDKSDPSAIKWMLQFNAKTTIWEIQRHNDDIEKKAARMKNPEDAEALRMQKTSLPDPDRIARVTGVEPGALEDLRANPSPEMRKAFDKAYGRNLSRAFLGED